MKNYVLFLFFLFKVTVYVSAQSVNWLRVDSCSSIPVNVSVVVNTSNVYTEINCNQPITYANGIFASPPQNSIVRMSASDDYKISVGHFQVLENFTADSAGNIYAVGKDTLIDNTYFSCCKYDSMGNLLWHFPIGTNYGVYVRETLLVPDGFVFGGDWTNYAGQWAGDFTLFIAKTDFNGNLKFLYKFDNHNAGMIQQILLSKNNIIISGSYSSALTIKDSTTSVTLNGFSNFFAKYSLNGNLITAKEIPPSIRPWSMVADHLGNIYFGRDTIGLLLDKFNDTCAFLSSEHIADGSYAAIYELKFDPAGNLYYSVGFRDSLVLNSSQTIYSPLYGVYNWALFRRNISGIIDWFIYPQCYQCYGGFDFFDSCGLAVNMFYRDSIKIYGNNYYAQRGNILSRINCTGSNYITNIKRKSIVEIFPNPSSGIFTVQLHNCQAGAKVIVRDVLGNCLFEKSCRGEPNQEINLSYHPKGIYFIEIVFDGERVVKKIVLE